MLFVKYFNTQNKFDNMSRHHFAQMMKLTTDLIEITVYDGAVIVGCHTEPAVRSKFNDTIAEKIISNHKKWIARTIRGTEYPSVEVKFCGKGFVLHKTYYFIEKTRRC